MNAGHLFVLVSKTVVHLQKAFAWHWDSQKKVRIVKESKTGKLHAQLTTDPMLTLNESGQDEALCCSTNKSNIFLCEQCSCNQTVQVDCQACQPSIQQAITSMNPQTEWLPTSASTKTY